MGVSVWVGVGVAWTGVEGVDSLVGFGRAASRFLSSVFRNTLIVVLRDL